jgi:hypothetical protein
VLVEPIGRPTNGLPIAKSRRAHSPMTFVIVTPLPSKFGWQGDWVVTAGEPGILVAVGSEELEWRGVDEGAMGKWG